MIAATNHEKRPLLCGDDLKPSKNKNGRLMTLKFRNFATEFEPTEMSKCLVCFSHAEIERVCLTAVPRAVLAKEKVNRQPALLAEHCA